MIVQPKVFRYDHVMSKSLVLKLMVLILGLVCVLWFRQQMGSKSVTQTFESFFATPPDKDHFNWCADHVVDFVWTETQLPADIKGQEMSYLREHYCRLAIEPISGVDIDHVEWRPLADSSGAAGRKTTLLWNPDLKLFKSGGMPFKSSKLASELAPAAP